MPPAAEQITQELERILASPLFSRADRQSRFLSYIVQKSLAGDEQSLRETVIGLEVYERPASYDPKIDPIVRVEAARLRGRLREYYEADGAEDPVRILMPKGSYVPTFEARVAAPEPLPGVASRPAARRWLIPAVLGALVLVGIGIAIWPRSSVRAKPIDSIAILPFTDLSEKKDLSYLTEGLTEQIQDELVRVRELRVVGSASAKQASANPDLRAAARQLGVDALLQGSIRAEAKKVRVTVHLLDGSTGSAVWSGSFDGERTGLFELEEQIARAVAGKLSIQLAARREGIDARTAPQRAQAYEYYQQARTLLARDSAQPQDEIYRLCQLASITDPLYAPPHACIAGTLIDGGDQLGGQNSKARALQEAKRALELDPGLPDAYSVLIRYYRDTELDWPKAEAVCADSLQRLPNAAEILRACGAVQGILLNHAKELELIRRAVALDPLSPKMHDSLMLALYQAGQFDEALSHADVALRLGSESNFIYRHRALILAAKGDPAGGLKVIEDAQSRLGGVPADWLPVRGYLLGLLKRRAETEHLLSEFIRKGALPNQVGLIYLGMGEQAKALDSFEQTLDRDPSTMTHAVSEYYMRVLDGDPRFEAIKRKLGLVPQVVAQAN